MWGKYLSASKKDLIKLFQKCYGLWGSELPLGQSQPLKKEVFSRNTAKNLCR